MDTVEVVVPGKPVPWARAGRDRAGHTFTPKKQAAHIDAIAWAIKLAVRQGRFEGPVYVEAIFDYEKQETRIKIEPRPGKATRPDVDNLAKAVLEGIERSGVLHDDAQVAVLFAAKLA